jgi:hypothetical protein
MATNISAILVDFLVRPKSFWYEHVIFVPVGMAKTQNKTKKIFGIGFSRTSGDTLMSENAVVPAQVPAPPVT